MSTKSHSEREIDRIKRSILKNDITKGGPNKTQVEPLLNHSKLDNLLELIDLNIQNETRILYGANGLSQQEYEK